MFETLAAKLKSNRGEVSAGEAIPALDKSGAKEDKSGQSGEKLEGAVQDINFDDVPENIRAEVIKAVTGKVKLYDAGFRTKSEGLSAEKKELEARKDKLRELEQLQTEIQGNPQFEKAVQKTIADFRAGKIHTEKQVDKSLNKLDQLVSKAESADQREQLVQLREIIREESGSNNSSDDRVKALEDKIALLESQQAFGLTSNIASVMEKSEAKYGKEFVDKYRDKATAMLQRYPAYLKGSESWRVFANLSSEEEMSTALIAASNKKQAVLNKQKENGEFPGGKSSSPWKDDKPKTARGRHDWGKRIANMQDAGAFK